MSLIIILGFIIFFAIHMVSLSHDTKESLILKLGPNKYKGIYAAIAALGFSLMLVARFDSGDIHKLINVFFYENIHAFMLVANILIISAYIPRNHFKKWLHHPMLLGVFIWSFSHVMINQHLHHTLFFGSLIIFSVVMFLGLIKRDGLLKQSASIFNSFLCLAAGLLSHVIIMYSHQYLAGIKII